MTDRGGAPRPWPLPYRVLFPIGAANAVVAALVWPLHATGLIPWPGPLHQTLMMLGFEQGFVFGFLLTAMPAFTGGARCRPHELLIAAASVLSVAAFSLAGWLPAAIAGWLVGLVNVALALMRRVLRAPSRPPEEFLFAAFGMVSALAGGALMLGSAAQWWSEPQPRLGIRLVSLGFVLSLVLGLGALLVPTFSGMRDPMVIPGLARAHQRGPRRGLYLSLIALFAMAFVAEASGHPQAGAALRASAAAVMLLLVWKLWRAPGRRDVPALTLWLSGWLTLAGLALAALWPSRALAGEHVTFIGGFGLLTLGISTRVIVSHGGHALAREARTLVAPVTLGVIAAMVARVMAETMPALAVPLLGASGLLWTLAWSIWIARALGLIARPARPDPLVIPVEQIQGIRAPGPGSSN